jgi:hypothetical protein
LLGCRAFFFVVVGRLSLLLSQQFKLALLKFQAVLGFLVQKLRRISLHPWWNGKAEAFCDLCHIEKLSLEGALEQISGEVAHKRAVSIEGHSVDEVATLHKLLQLVFSWLQLVRIELQLIQHN